MAKIHIHTKYSLLDAIIEPEELVKKVKEQDGENAALCVTEHGNLYSDVEIYKLCKKHKVKYLLGCEMYICDDVQVKSKDSKYSHLVVIAKNEIGRLNLNKLVSESCNYKYYGKPRIDFSMLQEHKEGLIVTSACMAGELQRALVNKEFQFAKEIILKYKQVFGDDYYLEYQSHSESTQQILNRYIVEIAKKLDVKFIVTTDAHYLQKEDKKYHDIFVQIGQAREVGETYNDCYIQSNNEILNICQSTSKEDNLLALKNTDEIANKCNVELPLSAPIMPHDIEIPSNFKTETDYLKHLCVQGWYIKKINLKFNKEDYKQRLAYEMDAIERMGFEGYFLLVYSYANSVKRRGIARGSAGGSLVCYLSNITDIDPLQYGLYFERFIDVGALDLLAKGQITKNELKIPDVDSDFGKADRNKVLQFVIEKYGQNRVASLGSFQYIWAKGAIKDIGKVLNIPFNITNEMTSQLNDEDIKQVIELGLLDKYKKSYPELFEYAERLAGLPKSFSAHPCFPKDTLVMTNEGYKKIQDISIGDLVLTHTNSYKYVAKTMMNTSNEFNTIKGIGFFNITSTSNHPYLIRRRTKIKPREYSNPMWIQAKDVIKSDMVCLPINTINNVPKYKSLPTNNEDFWWIIGRYIGYGWCEYYEHPRNEKRTIICCDKTTNKELNEIISKVKNLFNYRYVEEDTVYKLFIQNNDIFEFLQRFGKYANKKHLTKDIFDLPINLLNSFLNGYISADGYIDKQGYCNIKTVSYELANGIIQCVAKVYHINCSTFVIPSSTSNIKGRKVNNKEKYIVIFKNKSQPKDKCFFDKKNNCLWCYVKNNCIDKSKENKNVYNLSVIDDNTYTVNNMAVHNCGKVISMNDIVYYNATDINDNGEVILQGDMHTADDLGLIKADFLGLRTIDIIYDTLEMINKDYEYIAPHNLNFKDNNVYDNFRNGYTSGIFQFESNGMKDTLKKIECSCFDDLIVANALFRPGSIKYIDNYANRKKGIETFEYLHPDLEPILKDTYGIIVFQEQLIEIGRLAKLKNPDELRKATAKKKADLLDKIKPELYNGLSARGWTNEQLDLLWESMLDFAKYSFNKSHAAAYAMIAYICMYLKTYHSKEFICSWINSVNDKTEKVAEGIAEAMRMKINIYQGKYNNCSSITNLHNDGIIVGTNTIKYCNSQIAEDLLNLSKEKKYFSFIELLDDISEKTSINSRQLYILTGLNFFSDFGKNQKLLEIIKLYEGVKIKTEGAKSPKTLLPSLRTCSTLKKDKIETYEEFGLTEYLIKKYSGKETAKQYSQIDNVGLLKEMSERMTDKSMAVVDFIKFQKEYLQYVTYRNPDISDYYYIVTDFKVYKDDTKPTLLLHNLKTGKDIKTKIKQSKIYRQNPFGEFSILQIEGFTYEFKKKLIDGKWQSSDETEPILYYYDVIKR